MSHPSPKLHTYLLTKGTAMERLIYATEAPDGVEVYDDGELAEVWNVHCCDGIWPVHVFREHRVIAVSTCLSCLKPVGVTL